MRQKRKIDRILMATALVLLAAVSVAALFRLINKDDKTKDPALTGNKVEGLGWLSEEGLFNIDGLIDRHHPDNEFIFLLDEVQAPVPDDYLYTEPPAVTAPTNQTTTSPTTSPTTSGTSATSPESPAFRDVDIRYYVLSKTGLNLRQTPSTNAPVLKKLEYGQAIRVIGLSNDWAKVRLSGQEIGYVAKVYISQYPPVTTTTATTSPTTKAPTTTRPPVNHGQGDTPFNFVLTGTPDAKAKANFNIIKNAGLVNKEVSSNINRHYQSFQDNGDGTITVDGLTVGYIDKYGSRYATHYDGLEVCRQQIKARGGKCRLGHTTPTNHPTGSGIPAQRGLVAVGEVDVYYYPRGTVLFVVDYGFAVVADRSGGNFDLCYDADECGILTRSNRVSGIYVIARP
ncbi:MAG: SH3 domain-containing protein [Saccharofermentanales bacterium]